MIFEAFIMYYVMWVSTPSLYRESTDSLILMHSIMSSVSYLENQVGTMQCVVEGTLDIYLHVYIQYMTLKVKLEPM